MLFKTILGSLVRKIFVTQPWWMTLIISFAVAFVRKTHESFFKSYIEPWRVTKITSRIGVS